MQEFLADLHIHSRFSRATSKKLNVFLLAAWAQLKGVHVLGTGDLTHPKWRQELRENLIFDESTGLYVLSSPTTLATILPELPVEGVLARVSPANTGVFAKGVASSVRFMLQGEISSIYKRGGKVRRVHNLVYMPTFEAAERFSLRLAQTGNLHSDGRPILGLDSHDLLELTLETDPQAFLVPAHIWTPWFSLFGSKSGFDLLEDCFGDLSREIFALETGLSSDPAMNRLWTALDQYRLISNSDAHSGENLGREANLFSGKPSYAGMLQALKYPEKQGETVFRGTLEFFPEEGKYHMDGHRKCNVLLTPQETRALGGRCPVCGGALTVGVLSRVMELADREEPVYPANGAKGSNGKAFASLVPLPELLAEILGAGPKSRKVGDMYAKILERFGPELTILTATPEKDLTLFSPPLGEAVGRMRRGQVHLQGGYDGEYGVVRMFTDQERAGVLPGLMPTVRGPRSGGARALSLPGAPSGGVVGDIKKKRARKGKPAVIETIPASENRADDGFLHCSLDTPETPLPAQGRSLVSLVADKTSSFKQKKVVAPQEKGKVPLSGLNQAQERAVTAGPGPVLALAGPGTGKTRTLVARVLSLLNQGVAARRILAVTFTRRAAMEMDARLSAAVRPGALLPRTDTLHALALEAWHKTHADVPVLLSEESARRVFTEANAQESPQTLNGAWLNVNLARERMKGLSPEFAKMHGRYAAQKSSWNLADYTDLLEFWLEQTTSGLFTSPWIHVLVDEVQDLSLLQLTLVRALLSSSGNGFFGIGDPDQSIYGFRGAHGACKDFFSAAWPEMTVLNLTHNYRSRGGILQAAHAALGKKATGAPLQAVRGEPAAITLFEAPSADAEAIWIANRVADLIGRGSHTLMDAESVLPDHSPGDIAVLVRTRAIASLYRKALARTGVPVSEPVGDAFWSDKRVALILRAAGRMLGIAVAEPESDFLESAPFCPDKVLAKGPLSVSSYLSDFPPFDALFWQSSSFRALARAFESNGGWAELITWINLQSELEVVRSKAQKVQIMSIHAAKGLEFRSVFLPCLEDGLMPFAGFSLLSGKLAEKRTVHFDEELRLFYVGLTRAKDALFLSHASKRILYGKELRLKPSRFLAALPEKLLVRSTLVAHPTHKECQLKLL